MASNDLNAPKRSRAFNRGRSSRRKPRAPIHFADVLIDNDTANPSDRFVMFRADGSADAAIIQITDGQRLHVDPDRTDAGSRQADGGDDVRITEPKGGPRCVKAPSIPGNGHLCEAKRIAVIHRHNANHHARHRGFTVIEALAAGMLMAIFGAVIAATIGQSSTAAQRADDERLAAQWLDEVLTRINIIGPARLSLEGPIFGQLDDRFAWSATYEPDAIHLTCTRSTSWSTYPSGTGTRTVARLHDDSRRRGGPHRLCELG